MKRILVAVCTGFLMLTAPISAPAQELDDARIKELVLEAIRENPGIVMEAIDILRSQEAEAQQARVAAVLAGDRSRLENDPNAAVIGNPDGDVTLIEFFDYNCGYCRQVFPRVKALIAEDPGLRVVMREWPILGEASVEAARYSLAAREQGRYEEFHVALMSYQGRANEAAALELAEELGMDIEKLKADAKSEAIAAHFADSQELTQSLGVNGTPAFVIGEQLIPGAIELDDLRAIIAETREQG